MDCRSSSSTGVHRCPSSVERFRRHCRSNGVAKSRQARLSVAAEEQSATSDDVNQIRIEQHLQPDDTGKNDAMSQSESNKFRLFSNRKARSSRCDGYRLQADHLSHYASRRVGGSNQHWADMKASGGYYLQISE